MGSICAFDIDNTLTCGYIKCDRKKIQSMVQSIEYCKKKAMGVVINTARPPQNNILFGIENEVLEALGSDVRVYNMSRMDLSVPQNKLQNNILISEYYDVPFSNVVLIDDRKDTCDMISSLGAPTVHVDKDENGIYGIDDKEFLLLKNTLKKTENHECSLQVFTL